MNGKPPTQSEALAEFIGMLLEEAEAKMKQLGYIAGDRCLDDLISISDRIYTEFRRRELI